MNSKLDKITSISSDFVKRLRNQSITDTMTLANATVTAEQRTALAKKSGIPLPDLYKLAKKADLMRIELIDENEADALALGGIRCIEDLKGADPNKLDIYLSSNKLYQKLGDDEITKWVDAAMHTSSDFECESDDKFNSKLGILPNGGYGVMRGDSYASDLSEIIKELGVGIAEAQRNLDMVSLDMQKQILKDKELTAMGFNATWYAIPEATFTLKMEYAYSETGERRISVVPMNATYNNSFRTERSEQSTLTLRFVPVPAPEGVTERVVVPDFSGMTCEEAASLATESKLKAEFLLTVGKSKLEQDTMVVQQSLAPGTVVPGQTPIQLTYCENAAGMPTKKAVNQAASQADVSFGATQDNAAEVEAIIRQMYGDEAPANGTKETEKPVEEPPDKKQSGKKPSKKEGKSGSKGKK